MNPETLATQYDTIERHRKATGLPRTWHAALVQIATNTPTMARLGESVGISRAAVTALVDELERFQLAKRHRCNDRRSYRVELTRQGAAMLRKGRA